MTKTVRPKHLGPSLRKNTPSLKSKNPAKPLLVRTPSWGNATTRCPVTIPILKQGVASWYGKQFHGRKTAIGERYDMFAMTAAHPTMELPSYARVTNLSNGKGVIVRVNDRGPFLGDRIIDMSYAAAVKLGYHKAGTARVKVERITRRDIAAGNYSTMTPKSSLALAKPTEKPFRSKQTQARGKRISEVIGTRETPSSETMSAGTATTVSD